MVRSGLVTAWRLAGWPTRRSPSSVKATIEGVVRMPSAFSMTLGVEPSITATQELVVPRSMPMTFAMVLYPLFAAGRVGLNSARGKVDRAGLTPADHPLVRPPFDTLFAAYRGGHRSYRRAVSACKTAGHESSAVFAARRGVGSVARIPGASGYPADPRRRPG